MLRVQQLGYLGAAPELRYTPSGDPVATFRVGSTDRWKVKETGEEKERTTWLRWDCWGKSAENLAKLLKKGSHVFVEGSIRNQSWEKDGETHYREQYVVSNWRLLDRKPQDGSLAEPAAEALASESIPDIPF